MSCYVRFMSGDVWFVSGFVTDETLGQGDFCLLFPAFSCVIPKKGVAIG